MNKRIRELRKTLNLSQQEFADKINISRSNLGNIETGAVSVTDRVVIDICNAFGVSDEWIRSGNGEMFAKRGRDEEIAKFVGEALADEDGDIKAELIHVLSRLTPEQWKLLADIGELVVEVKLKNRKPPE